jgi:hypothetical protein
MAAGEEHELRQSASRIEPFGSEALRKVREGCVLRKRPERQRIGLSEERALASVEEPAHHRRLRTGVHVRGSVAVVLDPRADEPVEVLPNHQEVLELVENGPASARRPARGGPWGGRGGGAARPPRAVGPAQPAAAPSKALLETRVKRDLTMATLS